MKRSPDAAVSCDASSSVEAVRARLQVYEAELQALERKLASMEEAYLDPKAVAERGGLNVVDGYGSLWTGHADEQGTGAGSSTASTDAAWKRVFSLSSMTSAASASLAKQADGRRALWRLVSGDQANETATNSSGNNEEGATPSALQSAAGGETTPALSPPTPAPTVPLRHSPHSTHRTIIKK